ncbi:MAG TPA: response regulator transcription factor [Flavisolibacter sp.]|nr:response regulator transcription factor [Flavisolibacter sp.]
MTEKRYSLIIADAHDVYREALVTIFRINPQVSVVAELTIGKTAVAVCKDLQPDLVILDTELPDIPVLVAVQQILSESPNSKIICISGYIKPTIADKLIKKGAHGFVTKTSEANVFYNAITAVLKGEIFICEEIRLKKGNVSKRKR